MSTISRTSRRLAAGYFAVAVVAGLAATATAASANHPPSESVTSFGSASLPRTPDAIDGWVTERQTQQNSASSSGLPQTPDAIDGWCGSQAQQNSSDSSGLPQTPDAVDGWLR